MKLIALAAALTLAGPAIAQESPSDMAPQTSAPAEPTPVTNPPSPPAGIPAAGTTGGYQPANPPNAAAAPGQPVIAQPSPTVAEAYPAPPAETKYPICKKGQYDKCMQRGG